MVTDVRSQHMSMKKILLCPLVLVLSIFSVNAQSQDSQEEMQTLVQRVDTLEHELSYLKLTYELNTLNADMNLCSNEMEIKSLGIQLNLSNRNLNSQLGYAYQQYYESCLDRNQTFYKLIEAKKKLFALKVMTYPFSESEMDALMASYNVIDQSYKVMGKSMELLKIVIDAYNESL